MKSLKSSSGKPEMKKDATVSDKKGCKCLKLSVSGNLVEEKKSDFPLTRINFLIMAGAALAIIIGFLLMTGSGTTTEAFNEEIFSARRIIVGPTIAFLGFVSMAIGIVWRPKQKEGNPEDKAE